MPEQQEQLSRILVIDDEPFFLNLITELLSDQYHVSLAKNGLQGLKRAQGETQPDLILLDIMMPELDGYDTCYELKKNITTQNIPIIFLTAKQDAEDELKGFNLGAIDYITKPISPPVLLSRVKTQLAVSQQRIALEQLVSERTKEIEITKDAIVFSMGAMAEARDNETGNHLLRTQSYIQLLIQQLKKNPKYKGQLSRRLSDIIQRAAPLHDIGKISIPDSILHKPGALNKEERLIMNKHSEYGKEIIEQAEEQIGSTSFISIAKNIAHCHHERWDGSGYPQNLKQTEIPLAARLMAIADVYDALISRRCYKNPFSHEETKQIIISEKNKQFDPDIVDAFEVIHQQFYDIAQKYKDKNEPE